jgi:tetratricopeptide (TPR) repeat protein
VDGLLRRWWWLMGFAVLGNGLIVAWCAAQNVFGSAPSQKSSFGASMKEGFSKIGDFFAPKSTPAESIRPDDPTSLKNDSKPSPKLYVAVARLYEQSGKTKEAELSYQRALKEDPQNLNALLSYARMKENLGEIEAAMAFYRRAVNAHPQQAVAHNHLGLCYARQNRQQEAIEEIVQAVRLDSRNTLYRNNLAAVLVEQNRLSEAFTALREVHGDAAAYYNLGYLLQKKGDLAAAEHHFVYALRVDPKMDSAQRWLNYLRGKGPGTQLAQQPQSREPLRVTRLPQAPDSSVRLVSPPPAAAPHSTPSGSPADLRKPAWPSKGPSPGASDANAPARTPSKPLRDSVAPPLASPTRQLRPVRVPRSQTKASPPAPAPQPPRNISPPSNVPVPLPQVPPDPPELNTPIRLPPISARKLRNSPTTVKSDVELATHLESKTEGETPVAPLPPE